MSLVLVIDDDMAMRVLMARLVEAAGHNAVLAEGGDEGLEAFARLAPDLVITDLSMPEGGGGDLIAEIRRLAPDAKILAVSGRFTGAEPDPAGMRDAFAVDAVLGKPFRAREFCAAVDGLLA